MREAILEIHPRVVVATAEGFAESGRTSSLEAPHWKRSSLAEPEAVVPVVPGADIEDAGRRVCDGGAQAARAVTRFDDVDVLEAAPRHDTAQEVVESRHDVLGRVPPDDTRGDAPELGIHAVSLPPGALLWPPARASRIDPIVALRSH